MCECVCVCALVPMLGLLFNLSNLCNMTKSTTESIGCSTAARKVGNTAQVCIILYIYIYGRKYKNGYTKECQQTNLDFNLLWLEVPHHAGGNIGIEAHCDDSLLDCLHCFYLGGVMSLGHCATKSCGLKNYHLTCDHGQCDCLSENYGFATYFPRFATSVGLYHYFFYILHLQFGAPTVPTPPPPTLRQ